MLAWLDPDRGVDVDGDYLVLIHGVPDDVVVAVAPDDERRGRYAVDGESREGKCEC